MAPTDLDTPQNKENNEPDESGSEEDVDEDGEPKQQVCVAYSCLLITVLFLVCR